MNSQLRRFGVVAIAALAGRHATAATFSLSVSLSDSIRPVTHCGSGSLYGITETLPSDIEGLVTPLKAYSYRNPAMATSANQHAFGDAIKVSERLAKGGSKSLVQFDLADILPNWPYKWSGTDFYKSKITEVIKAKIASGRDNYEGYEIFNEPDGTWQTASGDINTVCWKPVYDLIRSLDPKAKIIGPSISYYQESYMKKFLTFAKANNCLPDLISWHQWGVAGFAGAYENYRALEKSLGIAPIEISINEYSSKTSDPYEGCPGYSVPFIAKFERYKIISAQLSWWWVPLPGRLGSLLTSGNQKGGGWYMYKWYGDMEGYMAKTVPPNDKSDGVDAFANVDKSRQFASIVLGGNSVGTVNVAIGGVPAWMGSSVNVKVEEVTWSNKDTPVAGPKTLSDAKTSVTNGSLTVPVNVASAFYAYRISITPVATGTDRGSVVRSTVSDFAYRVVGVDGTDAGVVGVQPGERVEAAVSRVATRPGVYFASPVASRGASRKVVVAAP